MAFLQRVLVALDGLFAAEELLAFAHALGRRHDCEIVLCTVVPKFASARAVATDFESEPAVMLREAAAALSALGVRCSSTLLEGQPADAIVTYAQVRAFDAIVIGTRGHERLERMILGSTTESVLRMTLLPVFVIHQAAIGLATEVRPRKTLGRYLVAVDGSDPSNAALAFASSLAAKTDVLLCCDVVDTGQLVDNTAIYGCDPVPFVNDVRAAALALVESRTASLAACGHSIENVVLDGDTATAILAAAVSRGADIIVCGSHGRHGIRRSLLGGVVQRIVARSALPVVVIRHFDMAADHVDEETLYYRASAARGVADGNAYPAPSGRL